MAPNQNKKSRKQSTVRLFVYGGLLVSGIRKYKGVEVQAMRNIVIPGYATYYERKVRNCTESMYHDPREDPCTFLGMLNLVEEKGSVTYGKVMYVTPPQMAQIRRMEPGYDLVQIPDPSNSKRPLYALMCFKPELLDRQLTPNPYYQYMVEEEVDRIQRNLKKIK